MNSHPRSHSSRRIAIALFLALASGTATVTAAPVNHGDFGPYLDVTESSATDPIPPARFGEPTLNADVLDFDPNEFVASASGGDLDITDVQLNYTFMTTPLAGVTSMTVTESGDLSLTGDGTALTQVAAGLSIRITILAVDGNPLSTPVDYFASSSFNATLFDDGPVPNWVNSLEIDLGLILDQEEIPFEQGVSKADVVIGNQLIAISEADSLAFIVKNDFRIGTRLQRVPEPSSWALMLLAAAVFGLAHRRRLAPATRRPSH